MITINETARDLLATIRASARLGITSLGCLDPDDDMRALCIALARVAPACLRSYADGRQTRNSLSLSVDVDGRHVSLQVHDPAPACYVAEDFSAHEWCLAVESAGRELLRLASVEIDDEPSERGVDLHNQRFVERMAGG